MVRKIRPFRSVPQAKPGAEGQVQAGKHMATWNFFVWFWNSFRTVRNSIGWMRSISSIEMSRRRESRPTLWIHPCIFVNGDFRRSGQCHYQCLSYEGKASRLPIGRKMAPPHPFGVHTILLSNNWFERGDILIMDNASIHTVERQILSRTCFGMRCRSWSSTCQRSPSSTD
jgi:hypothetical protein